MRTGFQCLGFLALALFSACQQSSSSTQENVAQSLEHPASPLDPTFTAHGGLEMWDQMNMLSFNLGGEDGEDFLLDLQHRYERIEGQGYTLGYDGQNYWSSITDTAVGEKNAKFLINLQFYFFAMPFVLADDGVHLEALADRNIGDKTFQVVKATFGDGIGVAPDDQYIVYYDPNTKIMEYLLYSVTYFNAENRNRFNALHYHTWQEVNDLFLPKEVTRYRWNNEIGTLGAERGKKIFADVQISSEMPDPRHFEAID